MRDHVTEPQAGAARASALVASVIILGGIALGLWSWRRATVNGEVVLPSPPEAQVPRAAERGRTDANMTRAPAPMAVPREALALSGEQIDPVVRSLVAELTAHPSVTGWLASDDLVRAFTVAATNVAEGRSPSWRLPHLRPEERFQVIQSEAGLVIDPQSFTRYDPYAEVFSSIDAEGAARLYTGLRPLMQETYLEMGFEGDIDQTVAAAIDRLLETPIPDGDRIELEPLPATYEFADSELAGLDHAQRHFLRMGPRNMLLVQGKLRELKTALRLDASEVP